MSKAKSQLTFIAVVDFLQYQFTGPGNDKLHRLNGQVFCRFSDHDFKKQQRKIASTMTSCIICAQALVDTGIR
jgi:hypothetical protein